MEFRRNQVTNDKVVVCDRGYHFGGHLGKLDENPYSNLVERLIKVILI